MTNSEIKLDMIDALFSMGGYDGYIKQVNNAEYRTRCCFCGDSTTNPNICTWCKDHIIYIAIALIACISMTSCNWFSGKSSDKLISFADSLIYGYYCSEDTMLLHYALKIYNETDSNKIDSRIAYTKLRVLFLLKHYSQGEEFVRSLDENIFFKPYHKKNVLKGEN